MASELDRININVPSPVSTKRRENTRAKIFRIHAQLRNLKQTRSATEALIKAGMPVAYHLVEASYYLNDLVEVSETDAPLDLPENFIQDRQDGFVTWQDRGQRAGVTNLLANGSKELTGMELVAPSQAVGPVELPVEEDTIRVVEIVGVTTGIETRQVLEGQPVDSIEQDRARFILGAPINLKKAA